MASYGPDAKDDDLLSEAKDKFQEAKESEDENRNRALADIRFARLGEQWPDAIVRQRQDQGKPMLTINRLPSFIRQVVNDARQNKPQSKIYPVDSAADIETAELYNGIIRHIEYNSSADIAYDCGIECAVGNGFGYWRIGLDYAHDDTFDTELKIMPVPDPFTVYGDPWAESFDGSDWNCAFVVEQMSDKEFEARYPGAEMSNWSGEESKVSDWRGNDWVQVAEYWTRVEAERQILRLSDGSVIDVARLEDEEFQQELYMKGIIPAEASVRTVPTWKVKQCIITDTEVLDRRDWPGKWIPIVPVYGDVVNVQGKRQFRSLIHDAIDPQRMFNYWRSEATYLLALAPKAPYVGPEKAFGGVDKDKWATANTDAHPYISYPDNSPGPPQRQQLDATAIGAIQQAMAAQDDMKSVLGIYDAALGARSNETSGKAILARQRESDVSTFHFIDNLTRSIRHSGRILLDLIPHVWPDERVVRLMGEDGTVSEQKVNGPTPVIDKQTGQPVMEPDPSVMVPLGMPQPQRPKMRTFTLTAGKYDLRATAGPSFTTKREEAAQQWIELVRAYPAMAPVVGDIIAKNLDLPGADEVAKRLKSLVPGNQIPPEIQQAIEEGKSLIQKLQMENQALKDDSRIKAMEAKIKEFGEMTDRMKLSIDRYDAETARMKVTGDQRIEQDRVQIERSRPQPNGSSVR